MPTALSLLTAALSPHSPFAAPQRERLSQLQAAAASASAVNGGGAQQLPLPLAAIAALHSAGGAAGKEALRIFAEALAAAPA